jgi:ubiquinone/menaquinone biosynthesis C-methylase UbiE
MIKNIYKSFERPSLWQKSSGPFWDDEHIAKQMLKAHLNPDSEAASRKHDFIQKSVEWIRSNINEGSSLLDLGCGPGLYTKHFSKIGLDVTGIDFSKSSIAYAKSVDEKTEYIYQNYLDIDYDEKFDVVTMIYCDYGVLPINDRTVLLAKIYRALKPGGKLVLDVYTSEKFKEQSECKTWTVFENGGFWSEDKHICFEAKYFYEANIVLRQYIIITDSSSKNYLIWDSVFTEESLTKEVEQAGFKATGLYGNVCGSKYNLDSATICAVFEKRVLVIDNDERE